MTASSFTSAEASEGFCHVRVGALGPARRVRRRAEAHPFCATCQVGEGERVVGVPTVEPSVPDHDRLLPRAVPGRAVGRGLLRTEDRHRIGGVRFPGAPPGVLEVGPVDGCSPRHEHDRLHVAGVARVEQVVEGTIAGIVADDRRVARCPLALAVRRREDHIRRGPGRAIRRRGVAYEVPGRRPRARAAVEHVIAVSLPDDRRRA